MISGVIFLDFLVETGPSSFPIPCISFPDINAFYVFRWIMENITFAPGNLQLTIQRDMIMYWA